jgi:hypothetical protein
MNRSSTWSSADVGQKCWVSDEDEAYIACRIAAVRDDGAVEVCAEDGRKFVTVVGGPEASAPPSPGRRGGGGGGGAPQRRTVLERAPLGCATGVDDMDSLSALHEACDSSHSFSRAVVAAHE